MSSNVKNRGKLPKEQCRGTEEQGNGGRILTTARRWTMRVAVEEDLFRAHFN
jgi:hypothetical protein